MKKCMNMNIKILEVRNRPCFTDVCLNEFVLDTASLGLKTNNHLNYASVLLRKLY